MDPITAIGLVSGILSIVGAAGKTLKLSWTLYNSVEGSSEETELRLKIADTMSVMSQRITPANPSAPTEEDRALIALAQECDKLTDDIKKELQTLRPKGRKSKTQSGLLALKTLMAEPKIKGLEKQLQHCRDQLHFHIAALSNENLKTLLTLHRGDGAKLTQLELSVTQLRQSMQNMTTMKVDSISDQAIHQLRSLLHVGQNALNEVAQGRILSGIKGGFEDMSYRYQTIDTPFRDTFEWIWDLDGKSHEATKFINWLSSGDGIFHICGKLGSGKSTLMKKLCRHERTRSELEKWTQIKKGRKLIIANFFFYALGSDPRQKSLMGLYRTLLCQILAKDPFLTRDLFPNQWNEALSHPRILSAYEILDDDIRRGYERLSKQHDDNSLGDYCFSFFIDGLDEYQATTSVDRREMVRSLTELANSASGNFKICVSSRIENPFMDLFSENARLYLHKLTKSDMEEYVQGNLQYVGTPDERQQLASSITKKAEGVFLWVVLVVQSIRKHSDDGARFSRLLREIESLPTELNELFQRILDSIGTEDRLLVNLTVSLIQFSSTVPHAKKLHLWLNLKDFYFLEDYTADLRFAESAQFSMQGFEPAHQIKVRAIRQLRGVCRGLVEADKVKDLGFIHRSVGDFFQQEKVRIKMHDESFNSLEVLSQLKLASLKQYWWDVEQQSGYKDDGRKKTEQDVLNRHSMLVGYLVELRQGQKLDAPPFSFLESLDTIPQLSVSSTVRRALACRKVAFHIFLYGKEFRTKSTYVEPSPPEICYTSRFQRSVSNRDRKRRYWNESMEEPFQTKTPGILLREAADDIDMVERHSTAVISPLLVELCSGRLEYPIWRIKRIQDLPLQEDELVMLVYYSISKSIICAPRYPALTTSTDDNEHRQETFQNSDLSFLRHLFERHIVSPNLPTHLAFGDQSAFIRIAAGNQRLSIWQHFLCFWAVVAAASGEFDLDENPRSDSQALKDSSVLHHWHLSLVLEIFIRNGADLQLAFEIDDGTEYFEDDSCLAYTLVMVLERGRVLELDVMLILWNTKFRQLEIGDRTSQPLPTSPLPLKGWIDRSRLPNKDVLLKLIDEKLGVAKPDDISIPDPKQPEDM